MIFYKRVATNCTVRGLQDSIIFDHFEPNWLGKFFTLKPFRNRYIGGYLCWYKQKGRSVSRCDLALERYLSEVFEIAKKRQEGLWAWD